MNLLYHRLTTKSIKDIINGFKKRADIKKAIKSRESIINEYLKNNDVTKLQLGCGPSPIHGWLNTDLDHNEKTVFMDAGSIYPLNNETIDYIFSEHLFEHLTFDQERTMLSECFRVLKKGGKMRIATPNLDFLMGLKKEKSNLHFDYIVHAIKNQWNLREVKEHFDEKDYNEVFVINNFFKDWGHHIIHNYSSLELMLKKAGFSVVTREKVGKSSDSVFDNIEQHGKQITDKFNLLETMIVESVKGA